MSSDIQLAAEYAALMGEWMVATGAAKEILFNRILTFAVKNPILTDGLLVGEGAFAMAFRTRMAAIIAAAVAKDAAASAAKCEIEILIKQMTKNFGFGPKGGPPMLMGAVLLGTVLLSTSQVQAETMGRENAIPSYNLYVKNYITRMTLAKKYHPQNNAFSSPQTFDEWYAVNRQ